MFELYYKKKVQGITYWAGILIVFCLTNISVYAQFKDLDVPKNSPKIESAEIWTVSNIGDRPTIVHNSKSVVPLFFYNRGYDVETVSDGITRLMYEQGVHFHVMDCAVNWGNESYSMLVERINAVKAIDPDAVFLLRLYLWAPGKWGRLHPDEIIHTANGNIYGGPYACTSYSSKKWIDQTLVRIDNTFLFMKNHGIYDSVAGVVLCAGGTGEWNLWTYKPLNKGETGSTDIVDYSPAMKKYSSNWMKTRYKNINNVIARYKMTLKSFTDIPLPDENIMKGRNEQEWFRSPGTVSSIRALDYSQAYADAVADAMLSFASRVRTITNGKRIVGTWFGQHLQATYGGSWGAHKNGYLSERRILISHDIDLIMTPPLYITSYGGGSASMQNFPDVWQRHGKFCLYEMDTPSYLLIKNYKPQEWMHHDMRSTYWGINGVPYKLRRLPHTLKETIAFYRRAFGICLIGGYGIQFWDMEGRMRKLPHGVFYDDSDVLAEFGYMRRIFKESLKQSRKSVAEIVLIYDNESIKYTRPLNNDYQIDLLVRRKHVETSQIEALNHCGAPYDVAYLSDFNELPEYKLYIFLNTWGISDRQIKNIHDRLAKENSSAVWVYAPGYVKSKKLDLAYIKKATGISVQKISAGITCMENTSNAITLGINPFFSKSVAIANPRFVLEPTNNPNVTMWGKDHDTGALLAGMRKMPGGWTSYYTSTSPLTTQTWADIAKQSGCHLYTCPGFYLRINKSYIMIHGITAGKINVTLPTVCTVTDIFSKKIIARNSNKFILYPKSGDFFTSILHLE